MSRLATILVLMAPLALFADGGQRTRRPPVKPVHPGIREDDFVGQQSIPGAPIIPAIPKMLLDDRMMGVILNPHYELAGRIADLLAPARRHRLPEVIEER